jgi:hypothetical protein
MLLLDIFLLRPAPYRHACENPRAGLCIGAFLVVTGTLYGLLVAAFQRAGGVPIQGVAVDDIPAWALFGGNVLSGIVVTIMVHVGITFLAWLMARAIGGPGILAAIYRATAYLLPLTWPALPQVARATALAGQEPVPLPFDSLYLPLAVAGLSLFLIGLTNVYAVTQGKGVARAAFGAALFALFTLSILLIV